MQALEDKLLLKRVCCGNQEALRHIYEKYRDDLFTVLVSLIRDIHTSEDCLQEVFINLAYNAGNFKIRHNLKNYLISCAINLARDCLRKKTTQLDCSLDDLSSLTTINDPVQYLINEEESIQIFQALAKLPYEQRETFILHIQGEMKFREIANLQKVSIKTVQSRYRYGVEKLQKLLVKETIDEVCK